MNSVRTSILAVSLAAALAGCGGEAAAPASAPAQATAVPAPQAAEALADAAPVVAARLSDAQVRSFVSELERVSRTGSPAVSEMIADNARGRRSAPVGPVDQFDNRSLMLELITPPPPGRVYAPTEVRSVDIASDGQSATVATTGGYTETQGNGSVLVATDERTATIALIGDKPKLVEYIIRDNSLTANGTKQY
jgi:hypothetical protein